MRPSLNIRRNSDAPSLSDRGSASSVGPAQPHIRRRDIRRRYSPKGRLRRPSGPARGTGRWPGRKASEASCVSASSTPTADPDSEGLEPRRGERSERGGSSASEASKGAAGIGSRGRDRLQAGHDADTHGLASGGSGPKKRPFGAFWGHGPSEQAASPGSSRGLDARGLRKPVHLSEQVGERVSEPVRTNTNRDRVRIVLSNRAQGLLSTPAVRPLRKPPGRTRLHPPETR